MSPMAQPEKTSPITRLAQKIEIAGGAIFCGGLALAVIDVLSNPIVSDLGIGFIGVAVSGLGITGVGCFIETVAKKNHQ